MLIKLPEIDPLKVVPLAQVVCQVNQMSDDKQIILGLSPQLRELEFNGHFFTGLPQSSSMYLSETCRGNSLFIEFTKDILKLALEVIFINYSDLLEWKCGTLILKHLQYLDIFFGRYFLQSTDILTSFKIDTSTALTQVEQPLCHSFVNLSKKY